VTSPPPGDPTLWELHRALHQLREDQTRSIAQLHEDLRSDLAGLAARIENAVTKDVYAADQRLMQAEMEQLRRDLIEVIRQRELDQAAQAASRRLAVSALVAPLVLVVVQWWLHLHGT
jgi:hypothetical protein